VYRKSERGEALIMVDTSHAQDPATQHNPEPEGVPRWVRTLAVIGLALLALFIVAHLVGAGSVGHHHREPGPEEHSSETPR
jgi:hypothetical protein